MGTDWTIISDIGDDEDTDWSKESPVNAGAENAAWITRTSVLNPNVSEQKFGIVGASNFAVEELLDFPENLNINPEDIQVDKEEWTILSEPD